MDDKTIEQIILSFKKSRMNEKFKMDETRFQARMNEK
jgi:hypothetical protein